VTDLACHINFNLEFLTPEERGQRRGRHKPASDLDSASGPANLATTTARA